MSEGDRTLIGWLKVVRAPVAEILLTVELLTGVVVMLNEAVVAPAGTVIVCGTVAALGAELNRETPEATGAIALTVTKLL